MLNRVIIFLFLFFIYGHPSTHFISANELNSPQTNKKYNLSICAIFKNEAKYLKEWIEYHRLFGVDHFYLYNIGSRDSFYTVLKPYIKDGIVTLINWPEALKDQNDSNADKWALSTQIPAYENAVNFIARDETKWLVLLDIDEFLVCPKENIKDLLKKYEDYSGISLSSDFYDAAIQDSVPKKTLIIQSLDLTGPPVQNINKSVEKMIFKPDLCRGFFWPPYQCRFKQFSTNIAVNRQELRINHYINKTGHSSGKKSKFSSDARSLSETDIVKLLEKGFVIEDQDRYIYRYVPEVLKRMGHKTDYEW